MEKPDTTRRLAIWLGTAALLAVAGWGGWTVWTASRGDASQPVATPSGSVGETRIIAFGDSGDGSAAQKRMAALMDKEPFDAVIHTGDVVYPRGGAEQLRDRFDLIYSARIKDHLYPSLGNHDYLT